MDKRLISYTEQFFEDGKPISLTRAIALYEQAVRGDGIAAFTPEALCQLREVNPFQVTTIETKRKTQRAKQAAYRRFRKI